MGFVRDGSLCGQANPMGLAGPEASLLNHIEATLATFLMQRHASIV